MKKLEQFNAETTPLGTPLITRNRKEVSQWFYFNKCYSDEQYPVSAIVDGERKNYTKRGSFYVNNVHDLDLFIAPKIEEIWVNVYRATDGTIYTGADFSSEKEALDYKQYLSGYIKTIKITDEI